MIPSKNYKYQPNGHCKNTAETFVSQQITHDKWTLQNIAEITDSYISKRYNHVISDTTENTRKHQITITADFTRPDESTLQEKCQTL